MPPALLPPPPPAANSAAASLPPFRAKQVVLVADGQVTMGGTVVKPNVRKTRKIGELAIGGFAGATADALTLFERLETKLEEHSGQLTRSAVELSKLWRMDKYLRRLDVSSGVPACWLVACCCC